MNNMGSSNSVVRMDMKSLISDDIKLAAISYTMEATQTLLSEYTNVRRKENPLYMMIKESDSISDSIDCIDCTEKTSAENT